MTRTNGTMGWMLAVGLGLALAGCGTETSVMNGEDAPDALGGSGAYAGTGGSPSSPGGGGPAGVSAGGTGGGGGTAGVGAGSEAGSGGNADVEPPADCETGVTPGNSVLVIGDSYVDLNLKAFTVEVERLARENGSLGANEKYTDLSISGATLDNIISQYGLAGNSDGHIKTVLMDGGGNDVLVLNRSCIDIEPPPSNASCVTTVDSITAGLTKLWAQMAADGVQDVIYFFYPYLPGGGIGGNKEFTRQSIDYALERTDGQNLQDVCAQAPLNCVFVDTRDLIAPDPFNFQDGVHPTLQNTQKISGAVWQQMQAHCIAQ